MALYDVEVQINLSIPVEAENVEQAHDVALGDALDRHIADGNYSVGVITVLEGQA